MPDVSLLEQLLTGVHSGARPMGLSVNLESPSIIELAPRLGFSWVLINQDHTVIQDARLLADMIRTAEAARLPHFVQVAELSPARVQQALDLGSYGVILPGVEAAEQIEALEAAVRYPPRGKRSLCSIGRTTGFSSQRYTGLPEAADAVRFANEKALLIPTLASSAAVANLDELMSLDSCPLWHLSFSNLSLSYGVDAEQNPRQAIRLLVELSERLHAAGKRVSAMIAPIEGQTKELAEGMAILGNDLPYALDATCMAFGMAEVRRISQAHQALREEGGGG